MMKSNLDVAYELISSRNEPVSFKEIWAKVVSEQGYGENEANSLVGQFYTNLSLDGRFVTLGENTWDLRIHHTFDKVHIDMNDVYSDVETVSDEEQDEEDVEYNKILDGGEEHNDEDEDENEEDEENQDEKSEESDY